MHQVLESDFPGAFLGDGLLSRHELHLVGRCFSRRLVRLEALYEGIIRLLRMRREENVWVNLISACSSL